MGDAVRLGRPVVPRGDQPVELPAQQREVLGNPQHQRTQSFLSKVL